MRLALVAAVILAAVGAATGVGDPAASGRVAFGAPDGLHIVDPAGSQTTIVVPAQGAAAPAWSPDGSRVAYAALDGLHVVGADGAGDRLVATGGLLGRARPAWSPDGVTIAFVDARGTGVSGDLFSIHPDGTGLRQLTTGGQVNSGPSWSPDGARLVSAETVSAAPLRSLLFVIRADGSGQRDLPDAVVGPVWDASPAWSPDGSQIAFVHAEGGLARIFVVRPDGTGARALADDPVFANGSPVWSAGGAKVLFASLARAGQGRFGPEGSDVMAVDVDGHEARLTESAERRVIDVDPRPSPEGAKVVFETCCRTPPGAAPAVEVMNADGTCEHRIASAAAVSQPDWQPAADAPAAPYECADLAVTASAAGGVVHATALNNGTAELTNVSLTVRPRRESAVFSMRAQAGTCHRTGDVVSCLFETLGRGQAATAAVDVRPLRVGRSLVTRVEGAVAQDESDSWNNVVADVGYAVRSCRVDGPGGGRIEGTPRNDVICGRRGADTIDGLQGRDRLDGGRGHDRLNGGPGGDVLLARDGERDVVDCGPGRDTAIVDARDLVRGCERVRRGSM